MYCGIHVYEKLDGMSAWLLGFIALRELMQNLDERRLVNDRSTRGIDESGRWLHCLLLGRSDQALRPLAQDEVDRQDVSVPEEFLLGDEPRSACFRLVHRKVLAPGDHVHAEREADSRNLRAHVAEAENAERLPVETVAYRELPAADAHMCVFQCDLTRARKDESPGHLDGGPWIASRMRYHDTSLGRGLHIDGRVARTGRCDALQSRQPLDDRPWQRCALAQNADHVERQETLDNLVAMRQMVIENGDRGAPSERRPVGHLQRGVLLIL